MGENQSPGVPQTPQRKALNIGATIVVVLIPYAWNGPALYVTTLFFLEFVGIFQTPYKLSYTLQHLLTVFIQFQKSSLDALVIP